MTKVSEIMTKNPTFCTPEATVVEAAELMMSFDCGEIPVIYTYVEKKVVGVITDRDICIRIVAQGYNPKLFKVEDCMTKPAIIAEENMSIEECCRIMEENQIRRLPIVDENGELVGILSQADVAHYTELEASGEFIRNLSKKSVNNPVFVS